MLKEKEIQNLQELMSKIEHHPTEFMKISRLVDMVLEKEDNKIQEIYLKIEKHLLMNPKATIEQIEKIIKD